MEFVPGAGLDEMLEGAAAQGSLPAVRDVLRWGIDLAERARLRSRTRHRPSRREAVEHPHRGRRPRGAARLRHRARGRRCDLDLDGRIPRLSAVRFARADRPCRHRGRRALGRLFARRHALRASDGHRAVPRPDARPALPPDPLAGTGRAAQPRAHRASRSRDDRARDAAEGAREAAADGRRSRARTSKPSSRAVRSGRDRCPRSVG